MVHQGAPVIARQGGKIMPDNHAYRGKAPCRVQIRKTLCRRSDRIHADEDKSLAAYAQKYAQGVDKIAGNNRDYLTNAGKFRRRMGASSTLTSEAILRAPLLVK